MAHLEMGTNERTKTMSDIATALQTAGAVPAIPKPNGVAAPDHDPAGWTNDDVAELAIELGIKPFKFISDNKGLKPAQLMDKLDLIQRKREEKAAASAVPAASGPSVVAQVAANVGVTESALQAELTRVSQENATLKQAAADAAKAAAAKISFKMSVQAFDDQGNETVKGGTLSVYGFGRFPVNLSRNALVGLFGDPHDPKSYGQFHAIRKFALANWDKFRTK